MRAEQDILSTTIKVREMMPLDWNECLSLSIRGHSIGLSETFIRNGANFDPGIAAAVVGPNLTMINWTIEQGAAPQRILKSLVQQANSFAHDDVCGSICVNHRLHDVDWNALLEESGRRKQLRRFVEFIILNKTDKIDPMTALAAAFKFSHTVSVLNTVMSVFKDCFAACEIADACIIHGTVKFIVPMTRKYGVNIDQWMAAAVKHENAKWISPLLRRGANVCLLWTQVLASTKSIQPDFGKALVLAGFPASRMEKSVALSIASQKDDYHLINCILKAHLR
jgi:hypothetical protein